jgi:hypothetical protein
MANLDITPQSIPEKSHRTRNIILGIVGVFFALVVLGSVLPKAPAKAPAKVAAPPAAVQTVAPAPLPVVASAPTVIPDVTPPVAQAPVSTTLDVNTTTNVLQGSWAGISPNSQATFCLQWNADPNAQLAAVKQGYAKTAPAGVLIDDGVVSAFYSAKCTAALQQ